MRPALALLLAACVATGARTASNRSALGDPIPLPLSWVAVGDSTTADYSNPTGGWPCELQRAWTSHDVDNIAIPGSFVLDAGPGYPTIEAQWHSVKGSEPRGLLQHGGINNILNTDRTGEEIFGDMLVVANDARDAGWTVAFVSPLPCGGTCTQDQEGRRQVIRGLQFEWAAANSQLAFDLDRSPVNCQDYFGNGVQALCVWARNGGTDTVHPSAGAQAVIGSFIADRMMAQELLP